MTYTREQILNMPAGRELDALVAEEVMGWKRRVDFDLVEDTDVLARYEPFSMEVREFHPSSDISAAWEVLNHLIKLGAEVNVGFYKEWVCSIDYPIGCNWREVATTASEAICKASLLAVMGL